MTFEENPFRVLQVSIYDTKATIEERADELSFADPEREDTIEQAQSILLNPKKRIVAEVQWFVCKGLFTSDSILPWIATIDKNFSAQKPEELRKKINKARTESKFPAVQDTAEIKAELKNIRYEIRKMIQDEVRAANHRARVNFANRFAEEVLADGSFGVIAEDFFDCYRLEMNQFFDATTKQIISLLGKIKINAHEKFLGELDYLVKDFCYARKPLDSMSLETGMNDFDDSAAICREVRNVAIELFNDKDLIDEPLRITRMLEKNFAHLPTLAELIRKDVKFLEAAKAQQPSQSFTETASALESIRKAMERGLHFEEDFEQANLNFYERFFKARHESILQSLMIRRKYKPEEWRILNAAVAGIYVYVANAMTWTRRADLALEMFQIFLPYAEASGDAELIARAKKDVADWIEINKQIAANASRGLSGCFSVVAAVVVFLWLAL